MSGYISVIWTTVLCVAIVKAIRAWINYIRRDRNAPLPPGPWSWPIFGNALSLGDAPHLVFDKMSRIYGPIFQIKIGTMPVIVLNNIEVIKAALIRQKGVFAGRPSFASNKLVSLGLGVAFNDPESIGRDWLYRWTKMTRGLHNYAVGKRTDIAKHIHEEVSFMTSELEKQCRESCTGYIDPEPIVRLSVGNAVCAMCFGKRYQADNEQFIQLLSMNKEFGFVLGAGGRIDVMPWLKIFPYYRKIAEDYKGLCFRMENWVLDRVSENISRYQPGEVRNILDALIENEVKEYEAKISATAHSSLRNLDDVSLLDQVDHRVLSAIVNDIFGASQDTFASTMLFFLYYMIRYPYVQERIRQDIYNVTREGSLPQVEDCAKLPYLEAVYHEVMRHSSVVPITIPHRTLSDTVLEGYAVPKDTTIFVNQHSANHDESIWNAPHDFIPERFLVDIDGKYTLDAAKVKQYLIFSAGSRKCPGYALSKILITSTVSLILHQCEVLPDPENPPMDGVSIGLTMKPSNLTLKLKKVNPVEKSPL